MHISKKPAATDLTGDPIQRHVLRQVGTVAEELKGRDERAVAAASDAGATVANYLALAESGDAVPLLAAQVAAMHEIAMTCLGRAAAHWAKPEDHHRNVWDAVRACTMFLRQLDALAKHVARKRAGARGDEVEATAENAIDAAAIAAEIIAELDLQEAHDARALRQAAARRGDAAPEGLTHEELVARTASALENLVRLGLIRADQMVASETREEAEGR